MKTVAKLEAPQTPKARVVSDYEKIKQNVKFELAYRQIKKVLFGQIYLHQITKNFKT